MGLIKILRTGGYNINIMKGLAAIEDGVFHYADYVYPVKRCFHKVETTAIQLLGFKFPENAIAEGAGSIAKLGGFMKREGMKKALIMTDKNLVELGLVKKLTDSLDAAGIDYAIYDGVVPDPTVENVEAGYALYKAESCDVVIGFGGGSPIDAAKVVAGRVVRPDRPTDQMGGIFGVTLPSLQWIFKKPENYPKTICIPTTSGTGAEITFSAVITNRKTGRKYTVNDTSCQPDYSLLDPELTYTMDPNMTALTGIDALSHLTEAYVGDAHNQKSDAISQEGIKLIFDNLATAVAEPENEAARAAMQRAGHLGGKELITGFTTYVHPFAHKAGAITHITHGYLIGSFLPPLLEFYRPEADERLAELAELIGVAEPGSSIVDKAEAYIQAIRDLCAQFGITGRVPQLAMLNKNEFIASVRTESFAYPTPKQISDEEICDILDKVSGLKD